MTLEPDLEWESEVSVTTSPGWRAPTCFTCRWWERNEGNINSFSSARCHRRAPIPTFSTFVQTEDVNGEEERAWSGYTQSIWPVTEADDWCGDHMP
jgi:hypothetical protein